MFARELEHMGWLRYEPINPVRPSMLGEVVYNEHWQALVRRPLQGHPDYYPDTPNAMLACILRGLPHGINQREAAVATTMIIWLGTSCGQSFINQGRRYGQPVAGLGGGMELGYIIAWAVQNARSSWTNHGYRLIEHLLAPLDSEMYRAGSKSLFSEMAQASAATVPELSTIDHEVCEQVAGWLGSELGQAFILEAEREIELRRFARPPATSYELSA